MAEHRPLLRAAMRALPVLTALSALVAIAALALSAFLFSEVREQRAETRQVRGLAIHTASTVVAQHKTLKLLLSSQRSLLQITKQLATPQPAPPRTLYYSATP